MIHGILLVDKPKGMTSFGVVDRLKRYLRQRKVGHGGTLDPISTGLLVVGVGEGTKLLPLLDQDKEYLVTLHLGVETDTQDATGQVITTSRKLPSPQEIHAVLEGLGGRRIVQVPPMYSALKRQGVPLYRLARQGIEVERPPREVEIYELEVLRVEHPRVTFRLRCSRGTYVRTLCADVGRELGCGAHLEDLRRLASGPFRVEEAWSLEAIRQASREGRLRELVIPPAEALRGLASLELNERLAWRVRTGQHLSGTDLRGFVLPSVRCGDKIKILYQGALVAVAEALEDFPPGERGQPWRLLRVFNPQ